MQLELDWDIPPGVAVEICSYPWQRRIVDSNGLSLAAYLISENPYLDKVRFQDHEPKEISWTATGLVEEDPPGLPYHLPFQLGPATSTASKMILLWHDAYQVLD
jgi:hypothetical protein